MSGRHRKIPPVPIKIRLAGGVMAGAALAGAIAASATVNPTEAATQGGSGQTVASLSEIKGKASQHKHAAAGQSENQSIELATAHESKRKGKAPEPAKHKAPAHTTITAQQVIKLAKSQVGTSEDHSGETKFNAWYMSDARALQTLRRDGGKLRGYHDAAWCDMFVSWIGSKLGISRTLGFDAYALKHAEWFKDNGRWGTTPRPGAVTFFSWTGNSIDDIEHVGFTIKDNGDGTIRTIEGNTHNSVAIRTRDKSTVVGYGYPDYAK